MQHTFSTYRQCCFTSLLTEPQMLLKCCILHIDMILPMHAIFCIFVSMPMSRFINYIWSFIMIFLFIAFNQIIALKQSLVFIWTFLSKFSRRVLINWKLFTRYTQYFSIYRKKREKYQIFIIYSFIYLFTYLFSYLLKFICWHFCCFTASNNYTILRIIC